MDMRNRSSGGFWIPYIDTSKTQYIYIYTRHLLEGPGRTKTLANTSCNTPTQHETLRLLD